MHVVPQHRGKETITEALHEGWPGFMKNSPKIGLLF